MSVEDIQKVNKLAQDLLNQNICSDRQEAVQKAEQMLNKSIVSSQSSNHSSEELDKYKNMIQRQRDYFERQFNQFKLDIQSLAEEIRLIKSKVNASRVINSPTQPSQFTSSQPAPSQNSEAPKTSEESIAPVPQATLNTKPEEPHPRVGRNNPSDVSIEKMFYYGNK